MGHGRRHARHDRDHDVHRHPAAVAVHADDAADDGDGHRRLHGGRWSWRQAGARDQRRPQGVPALSRGTSNACDVVGGSPGDVLQLSRTASRRSALDHRDQPAMVTSIQRRLLLGRSHRSWRRARRRPAAEARRRRRVGRTAGSSAASSRTRQPHVGHQVPAHPRVDPRLPETGATAHLSEPSRSAETPTAPRACSRR